MTRLHWTATCSAGRWASCSPWTSPRAVGTCAACGARWAIAQVRVYPHAPGMVARCPACDAVLLRLVRGPGRAWLDLRGITCLEVAIPGP